MARVRIIRSTEYLDFDATFFHTAWKFYIVPPCCGVKKSQKEGVGEKLLE